MCFMCQLMALVAETCSTNALEIHILSHLSTAHTIWPPISKPCFEKACKTNFAKNRLYHASGSCKDRVARCAHILQPLVVYTRHILGDTKPDKLAKFGSN